jgi:hypothetical protein
MSSGLSIPADRTTVDTQQLSNTSVDSDANAPRVAIGQPGARTQQSPQTSMTSAPRVPFDESTTTHSQVSTAPNPSPDTNVENNTHTRVTTGNATAKTRQSPQTSVNSVSSVPFDESTATPFQFSTSPRVYTTFLPETAPHLNGNESAFGDLTRRYHRRSALELYRQRNHDYFGCSHTNALGSNVNFNNPLDRIANDDSHALDSVFRLLHLSVLVVLLFTLLLVCREMV